MEGVVAVGVSDGKVIHDQGKADVPSGVLPQAGCVGTRMVAMWQKEFLEVVIGNVTGLREAVHAFANFHIDVTIVDEVMEVVVLMMASGMADTGMCVYA